jgi:hypothetical protein
MALAFIKSDMVTFFGGNETPEFLAVLALLLLHPLKHNAALMFSPVVNCSLKPACIKVRMVSLSFTKTFPAHWGWNRFRKNESNDKLEIDGTNE